MLYTLRDARGNMDRDGHREYDPVGLRGLIGFHREENDAPMRQGTTDFTKGSIVRQMLSLSLPFTAADSLQALYGVADMMVVGRVVGPAGLSAMQVGGQAVSLITNIAMGLAVAATVLVAQNIGAGNKENQNKRHSVP